MQETVNVNKIGQEVLHQLEDFNKRMWDAVSFRMIHAMMSQEPVLKDSYTKTQSYRKQRLEKALKQSHGNERKAYQLLASEEFN
ncbi:MAG: hypothetical protein ABH824_01645 [Nanoarchaeota archaeon]|nr:hypothetical protein [Nanoarchaeota archaeon]MBU1632727.1 hypothetical protein [Nanoarchaeota archaeon]MBU1876272.1 hypothetical protein [Nanoarchaeota archaeon]